MWLVLMLTILMFLIFKSATNLISIENVLSAEIKKVTHFRGLNGPVVKIRRLKLEV